MDAAQFSPMGRRALLAGVAGTALLALPGCASVQRYSLVQAIRRLLMRASQRALDRLMAPGGFWDDQLARLDLPDVFGRRGGSIAQVLTSALLKDRLHRELNHAAEAGARRVAPIIADAVEVIGIDNAKALVAGGPSAATAHLRGVMAGRIIEELVPELGDALRLTRDPLVAEALRALTGVDLAGGVRTLAQQADAAIWAGIGREEAAIRADPRSTNDPVLIGVFGAL